MTFTLPSVSEESEGALDAELRALRARISRARALKTASERECVKLDKELKSHVEVVGRIQAIASAVGKENATVKEGLAATGTMGDMLPSVVFLTRCSRCWRRRRPCSARVGSCPSDR